MMREVTATDPAFRDDGRLPGPCNDRPRAHRPTPSAPGEPSVLATRCPRCTAVGRQGGLRPLRALRGRGAAAGGHEPRPVARKHIDGRTPPHFPEPWPDGEPGSSGIPI